MNITMLNWILGLIIVSGVLYTIIHGLYIRAWKETLVESMNIKDKYSNLNRFLYKVEIQNAMTSKKRTFLGEEFCAIFWIEEKTNKEPSHEIRKLLNNLVKKTSIQSGWNEAMLGKRTLLNEGAK